jgi:ATP synthase protein I
MVEDEPGQYSKLSPDSRLESLDKRLEKLQSEEAKKTAKAQGDPNMRVGQLVLSHLVGAPLGGGLFGWVLDRWLGTKPWLMLALLFAGFAVGVMNVLRISKNPQGHRPGEGQ